MSILEAAYKSVYDFNNIAGNYDNVTVESVNNQLSFIFSELEETITGFENNDAVELLDGCCDLYVTVSGLMQKLACAGFDVNEAIKRVNANNMSKYVKVGDPLHYEEGHTATRNDEYNVYVIKDANSKIRKPLTFKAVNLTDLVPAGFFKQ